MAVKKKLRRSPVNLRDREALLNHNPAPADVVDKAREIKEQALLNFGLGDSVIASWVYSKCYHHIPTTAIPTMAVVLLGDGTAMLLYNPYFTVSLGEDGAMFVLYHEARHLIQKHLFIEPHLNADPNWTLATEACINHVTKLRLKRGMPEVDVEIEIGDAKELAKAGVKVIDVSKDGEEPRWVFKQKTGVDPDELYKRYVENLKEQNLAPVSREAFTETDFGCYAELSRMTEPPQQTGAKGVGECIHQQEGDGSGEAGEDGGVPMDAETAENIGKQILHNTMQAAMAGKEKAREELLELGERTDGSTDRVSKIWGDLGLARLRGETPASRRVDWWKQWLNDTLASLLKEGDRLVYPKKRGAIDLALGLDPLLMHRGHDELKQVLIAVDASGSMYDHVIQYISKLVGYTDGVESFWCSFDGVLVPFQPGQGILGGGGTNFGLVVDYAEGRLEVNGEKLDFHPDAVIMVTDGYAAPVTPQEPDKWIWLITENGSDDWIKAQPSAIRMKSHHIVTGEGVVD